MNTNSIIHPIYGEVLTNSWLPVYAHRTIKETKEHEFIEFPCYEILFLVNKEPGCIIRNKNTEHILQCFNGYYALSNKETTNNYSKVHITLSSAFPQIPPLETVDHIDDDYTNNHICNLRWLSRSDNSRKGQKKSVIESKKNGGKNGKHVMMKQPNIHDKHNRNSSTTIGLFRNIDKCAQYIIDHVVQKDKKPLLKTVSSKIRRAIQIPEYKAYGFYFDSYEINIEHEDWKHHPKHTQYAFSTHGRSRNGHGYIAQQQNMRCGSRYKQMTIDNSKKYIHRLIWETFMGEIPDHLDVMHDDEAPSNEDHSYRNWLCDLTLGPRSENMKSFHANGHNNVCETNTTPTFVENIPQANILNQRKFLNNPLGNLMRNGIPGIQYIQAKGRPSKYVLSRRFSVTGKDISSSGDSKKTDEEKFLQIIKIYQENCKKECQQSHIMELNMDDFSNYITEDGAPSEG